MDLIPYFMVNLYMKPYFTRIQAAGCSRNQMSHKHLCIYLFGHAVSVLLPPGFKTMIHMRELAGKQGLESHQTLLSALT
jgi:hypothetical protein